MKFTNFKKRFNFSIAIEIVQSRMLWDKIKVLKYLTSPVDQVSIMSFPLNLLEKHVSFAAPGEVSRVEELYVAADRMMLALTNQVPIVKQ